MSAGHATALVIARIGGLSADLVAGLATDLGAFVERQRCGEEALRKARGKLVERLYEAVHAAGADERRILLAVKRDAHNGRSLSGYRQRPEWRWVEEAAGASARRVVELEERLTEDIRDFEAAHQGEMERQSRWLAELIHQPLFRCGLGIASPSLAHELHRLRHRSPAAYGRRERRLATTLLRYATRAALKPSPFSTFTTVSLARIEDGEGPPALVGGGWRRRSLVRLRRHLLDRCTNLLQSYPPWRERLLVALNDSVTTLEDGRLLYQRPSHYRLHGEERRLRYEEESLVRVDLPARWVERFTSLLGAPLLYRELAARLVAAGDGELAAATARIDRLVDIGYLQLIPPWSTDDGHLEKTVLEELGKLAWDPALQAVLAPLARLVELEEGLLEDAEPAASIAEMRRSIDLLIRGAANLAGIPSDVEVTPRSTEHDIYQDVWRGEDAADGSAAEHAIVRLGRCSATSALRSIEPVVRYTRLFDHRLDFAHTLGALMLERWGERCQVPLLEVFRSFQPQWQEFIRSQVRGRDAGQGWRATWNPLGLADLAELARWREVAYAGLNACFVDGPGERRIAIDAFQTLLAPIPSRYTDCDSGACLFVQPATADGTLWVVNRLKEGTGRFASRYTPVLPSAVRDRYTTGLRSRGTLELDGEMVELLDIQCVQGDTLNVHAPQTPKVLTFPGARTDLPRDRRRALNDLVLALGADGQPRLRDRSGQRYIPVQLGVGFHDYMPTLVKFLCVFGPSEMGAVFPPARVHEEDGVSMQERTVIGNLVLHRKSWTVPVAELRVALDGGRESEAFAALHLWRQRCGLPRCAFALERVPHPILGFRYRPQYVDFTSPLFVPVVRSILQADKDGVLTLVEPLPPPELFPADTEGRRWAVELLIDSLSLRSAAAGAERRGHDVAAVGGWAAMAGAEESREAVIDMHLHSGSS